MKEFIQEIPMPEPSATMLDRLRFLVSASRRSQAKFSKLIDIDPSSMSRLLSGRIPITRQFINRLVVNLGISKEWFTDGVGVPFPREAGVGQVDLNSRLTSPGITVKPKGAPVYDIDATAGVVPISNMFAEDRIIGHLDVPKINPGCPVVRVSGDSMFPTIPDGSYISIREIHDASIILWGAIYLVQLEDYRMVKSLRRHPSDPALVVLHSENPEYDDIEIPRKSIQKLFLVENVINLKSIV